MSLRTLVAWTLAIDLAASGLVRLRDPKPFAMIRPDPPTRARRVVGAVAVAPWAPSRRGGSRGSSPGAAPERQRSVTRRP